MGGCARRVAVSIGALTIVAGAAREAEAQPMAEREATAQALYDSATALMDAHDYANACPKLEEVTNLVPEGLGARLTLAECYEGEGRIASAWAQYAMIAPRAARAGQTARKERAEAKMQELAPRVSKLTIVVEPPVSTTPGLTVTRDGVEVGKPQWGVPVPIDAGDHVVEARAPGKIATRHEIHVDDGTTPSFMLEPLADAPVEKPGPVAKEPPKPPPPVPVVVKPARPWQAPLGFVIGGVGLSSAGAGLVLGGLAVGKSSDASQECDKNLVCSQRGLTLRKDGRTFADASTGLLVAGGTLTVVGIVVVATAPRAKTTVARLGFGPASVGLSGEF